MIMTKLPWTLVSIWLLASALAHGETLELQSNEVPNGTIQVSENDADRSDWEGIEWYEWDDDFSELSPVDIDRIQVAHDATHVYFHLQALVWDTDETWRVGTYIDADADPLTGYNGDFLPLGADILLEDSLAHAFVGDTQVAWGWSEVGPTVRNQSDMLDYELAVPRATLGNPTSFDFLLYANNTFGEFNMPDDIYPNGPGFVLSYELGEAVAVPGDFDGNLLLDADDINLLSTDIAQMLNTAALDLNGDSQTSPADVDAWLELRDTRNGDADLSGEVGFSDFLVLSGNFGQAGVWSEGDFDSDGSVAFADFLILSANFGQTGAVASVPEPSGPCWLITCVGVILGARSRRTRK